MSLRDRLWDRVRLLASSPLSSKDGAERQSWHVSCPGNGARACQIERFLSKSKFIFYSEKTKRDKAKLKECWNLYLQEGTAFAAIQTVVATTFSGGWEVHGEEGASEEDKVIARRIIDRNGLVLQQLFRDALIFGDGFAKKNLARNGHVYSLEPVFPLHMDILEDGITFRDRDGEEYTLEEIFHLQLFPRSDNVYGISVMVPAYDAMKRKREIDKQVYEGVKRHGFRKFHIKLLPDQRSRYPDAQTIAQIEEKFEELESKNEIITTDRIQIEPLDTRGGVPDVEEYLTYFTDLIATGVLVPFEALGLGQKGSTYATAKIRAVFFRNIVQFYKDIITRAVNEQLLTGLEGVYVRLRDPHLSTRQESIAWIKPLLEYDVLSKEEIREKLGLLS